MTYFNEFGQARLGWNVGVPSGSITPSTLWNSIYSVYNADSVGSSSLKTSLYAAYNGESNANDSFGTNNGTAVGGLTYTTGVIGNAFTFNGSNSRVSLPNNSLNFTGDFSISIWVNFQGTQNTSGAQQWTTFIQSTSSGGSYGYGWEFLKGGSNISFLLRGGSTYVILNSSMSFSPNVWYHFVVTRKKSTGTKIYRNGVLMSSNYAILGPASQPYALIDPSYQATQTCTIGDTVLSAKIDAVNIWQKELTQSEITELYNSGNGSQYITDNFYKPTTNDALNTYNGTAQGGLTYGVGKVGTAFQFNGSNAYFNPLNSSGQFNFTGDFTVSFWYRSSNLSRNNYVISNYKAGGTHGYGWMLYQTNSALAFGLRNGSTLNQVSKLVPISTNTWCHIVGVRQVGQPLKLYFNGSDISATQDSGTSASNIPGYTASQPFSIGGLVDLGLPAVCDVDALNFWNRAVTASEITELYNSGNGKQYPN